MYAQVCLPFFINKTFTYVVPNKFINNIKPGSIVEVKFNNKLSRGFITSLSSTSNFKGPFNKILSLNDSCQIPDELWKTLKWMSEYYVTPIGKITQTTLSWAFKDKKSTTKNESNLEVKKEIKAIQLSPIQKNVYNKIHAIFKKNSRPHFLYGVPGSGKTEIYLKLTNDFFGQQKSCLILVPEIVLSSQIFNRFQNYFGEKVLLWHSQASESYKNKVLFKLNQQNPYIIIGARSALFTPLTNLGLIIVDEEHDSSYKESDRQPCYNARDLAIIRAQYSNSMVLLGSATPSLETYYNSMVNNKYHLHMINERYGEAILPKIKIIDMNKIQNTFIGKHILSLDLINQINLTIKRKEQILILHNRRGFSSLQICNKSNDIVKCGDCDVILTFHAKINQLICHHCNKHYSFDPYKKQDINFLGYGTEQLETVLNELFPNAGILRMDSDSANTMNKQNKILRQFQNKEFNILLGTQMIAKGLDFSNITLVAVINADLGMMIPDFKSHEKMFQLIYQVIGRSGRSHNKGQAIIQTYNPNNHVIQMATNYDSKNFYNLNLESRKNLYYPPFSRLIRILFQSKNMQDCINSSDTIVKLFDNQFQKFIIGPHPCPIEKLSNQVRYHILIKAPKAKFKLILNKIKSIQNKKEQLINKSVKMLVDIDANSVL